MENKNAIYDYFIQKNGSDAIFKYANFSYKCDDYDAEFNEDLDGYVITFKNVKIAYTQLNIETNRLHADFNEKYLERYTENDDEFDYLQLSSEQDALVDEFVSQMNNLASRKGESKKW